MVLSHRGWDRLFARDPAILGRRLLVNGVTFEIVGVMPEGFRGLTVAPDDYWAPLSMLGHVRPIHRGREATVGLDIIGRLKPGLSRADGTGGTRRLGCRPVERQPSDRARRARDITLVPRRGTVPQPLEAVPVVAPLFFAFGLILLIGCANVANLLLARAVARQREIGIRLSLGATRRRIVRQLLTESLLLALVAAAAGFAISRVVLEAIINAVMTSMAARYRRYPIVGTRRGLARAAVSPRRRRRLDHGVRARPRAASHAHRTDQDDPGRSGQGRAARTGAEFPDWPAGQRVGAAADLGGGVLEKCVCRGHVRSWNADLRHRRRPDRERADAQCDRAGGDGRTVGRRRGRVVAGRWHRERRSRRPAAQEAAVAYKFVSPEYFSVLDIAVVRGRAFTPAERTSNLSVAIVSETTARALWPNADAVGQVMRLDPDPTSEPRRVDEPPLESRTFTVVGVVRDVAGFRIAPFKQAVVYVPTSAAMPRTSLIARVHGDPELARQTLLNRLTTIDPDMARQVMTMRTLARMETYFLQIAFWLTVVLGGLALALTLSGLFSVLSYLVEQRTREIGVRMALGATTRDVTRLVLSQSIRPVGFGLFIGGGSAAGLAALLLATPAAATIGEIVHVLDPVAYAVSLLIIIAACLVAASIPATRAARLDPTRALRQE